MEESTFPEQSSQGIILGHSTGSSSLISGVHHRLSSAGTNRSGYFGISEINQHIDLIDWIIYSNHVGKVGPVRLNRFEPGKMVMSPGSGVFISPG